MQIIQVLPGDFGDRDVGDFDFMLADEREEQIEGAFEVGQGNLGQLSGPGNKTIQ